MNNKLLIIFISILSMVFLFVSTAEAKRFGGGSSFGSKKSYSSPFKQKSTQQKSFAQQKASATNQQRKQQLSSRGGLMGMLGGLALGGLLGALFFGGAFENFNFFDFLIIGGIIFAVIWFLKRKRPIQQAQSATPGGYDINMQAPTDNSTGTENTSSTQHRFDQDKHDAKFNDSVSTGDNSSKENKKDVSFAESFGMGSVNTENKTNSSQSEPHSNEIILPDWFNQKDFLSGARSAYTLLQKAWDTGDLEAIKGLTTDSVYSEISQQIAQEPLQGRTHILQLNAEMVDFNELEEHTEAAVLFDALLREETEADSQDNEGRATQVKELWHFVQRKNSTEPTWYLDGIQQLE